VANTLFQTIGSSSSGSQISDPNELLGVTISTSVASSALTITLKNASGSTPDSTNPVKLTFRNATLTSGIWNERTITSSLTVTVGSGSTLNHISGYECPIYVYAADLEDVDGTRLLCVSTFLMDETRLYTITTGADGSGADLEYLIYHSRDATTYTSRPIKLLGILFSTQATAGTWASIPTVASPGSIPSLILRRNNVLRVTTSDFDLSANESQTVDSIHYSPSVSNQTITLPLLANSFRRKITVILRATLGAAVIIDGNGTEPIENDFTVGLYAMGDFITLVGAQSKWLTQSRKQTIAFNMTCAGSIIATGTTNVNCPTLTMNYGNGATTGIDAKFIAPVAGIYQFLWNFQTAGTSMVATGAISARIGATLSGATLSSLCTNNTHGTGGSSTFELNTYALVALAAGDQINPRASSTTGTTLSASDTSNYFAGSLVSPL
jgi:hypothetical protein